LEGSEPDDAGNHVVVDLNLAELRLIVEARRRNELGGLHGNRDYLKPLSRLGGKGRHGLR
jgi:hypothetical protein